MSAIDHEYTDDAVCPHCGYINRDSWALGDANQEYGETQCDSCDKSYTWSRMTTVKYSTKVMTSTHDPAPTAGTPEE